MTLIRLWRHESVRRRENDLLVEAGYQWDEWRLRRHLLLSAVSLATLAAGPIAFAQDDFDIGLYLLAIGAFLGLILIYRLFWPRAVLFTRDGGILTPHGIPWWFWVRRLGFPHSQIASIEVTSDCRECGVMLYTTEGRSILICETMHKADAHLVAVQLSKALREMRETLATLASRQHSASEQPARMWVR